MNNVLAGCFVAIMDAKGKELSERVPITAHDLCVIHPGTGVWLGVFASKEAKDCIIKTLIDVSVAPGDAVWFNAEGELIAALDRIEAGGVEGWQIVPVEPTEAMLKPFNGLVKTRISKATAMRVYQMMLSAAPSRPAAVEGWQLPETAPKDGTEFLAWCRVEDYDTRDGEMRVVWWEGRGQFTSDRDLGNEVFSHWRALPPPPASQPGKEQ